MKERLLLHICCAPDATAAIEKLSPEYHIEGFFYNPNIYPEGEYIKRFNEINKLVLALNFITYHGEYNFNLWLSMVKGFENEVEGGRRCEICYNMRIKETIEFALKKGIRYITTTLTMSPHKNAPLINKIGKELSELSKINYLAIDFKRNNGFKRSIELSKEFKIYRQNYCGCPFSMRKCRMKESDYEK